MNKELSKEEIIKKYNLFEVIPLSPEPKIYFNERIKTAMQEYSDQEKRQLEKENKELKEELEKLTKTCNDSFDKIQDKADEIRAFLKADKQNKSNY